MPVLLMAASDSDKQLGQAKRFGIPPLDERWAELFGDSTDFVDEFRKSGSLELGRSWRHRYMRYIRKSFSQLNLTLARPKRTDLLQFSKRGGHLVNSCLIRLVGGDYIADAGYFLDLLFLDLEATEKRRQTQLETGSSMRYRNFTRWC